jgi:hypothetical protein
MSKTLDDLNKVIGLEKTAYVNYVSSYSGSGIATLVRGGYDFDKAASLVKEACEQDEKALSLKTYLTTFEKMASYISELESKLDGYEKVMDKAEEAIASNPNNPLMKLASVGFTPEEIEHMSNLPENLLEKVASSNGGNAWEMGSAVGVPREKTDALLEFILG